jgi:photosystem II stability/assembly factor-like uncharacterized protein
MVIRLALIIITIASLFGFAAPVPRVAAQEDEEAQPAPQIQWVPRWDREDSGVTDNLFAVSFVSPLLGWAVGANNTIIRTRDGGQTWTRLQERRERGTDFREVTFTDETHGWVRSNESLLYTSNGGDTWQPARKPEPNASRFGPGSVLGATRLQLAEVGANQRLYRTDDGGQSWTPIGGPITRVTYDHLWFTDLTHGWAAHGFTPSQLAMTADGGVTWSPVSQPINQNAKIVFASPNTGWILGENGGVVLNTTNGGQSWTTQSTGLRTSQPLTDIQVLSEALGYILTSSDTGVVLRTADGGASWQSIGALGTREVRAVHFTDAEHGWVVGDQGFIDYFHLVPVEVDTPAGSE